MCTATAKGLARAAHKLLTAVEPNLAKAACRVHSCTGQRQGLSAPFAHGRTSLSLKVGPCPLNPRAPPPCRVAIAFRSRLGTVTTLPSHAAPPCCCLAVAAALEHQGTASTYACTRAYRGHVRRALHTRPDPAAKANSWFCLPRSPRCRRRVARSHGHAVGHGHAACLTPAHACTPNTAARPCLALAVVHCRTSALPNASRARVNHSGCEPCPWPCSLPNRCPEIPFTLPCSFFSLVVHRTPSR